MPEMMLATKLYIPVLKPNLVQRAGLVACLEEGLLQGHRLSLISAPAGYGKTTLAAEWVRRCSRSAAWISLDERDNDPVRFLSYLVEALQRIDPQYAVQTRQFLLDAQPQSQDLLLTSLINELAQVVIPLLVVLDDYHLIHAQSVHDAAAYLLEHLPPQVHLVILTRADPPLPVARFRGRGLMTELRLNDLRFTREETASFINEVLVGKLSTEELYSLWNRTEGWAAGLQMASLALQAYQGQTRQPGYAAFIQAFSGSNRYILDYLMEEVFQRQPEAVRNFLIRTSILDRLNGPLCDAILAVTPPGGENLPAIPPSFNSQSILESLERANLFIIPLDAQREWFRYHRLFSDLLNQRLFQIAPGLAPQLHQAASLWFEQHSNLDEAVQHAHLSGDMSRTADLVEKMAETWIMRSELLTFSGWVERLPVEEVNRHPLLRVYIAWSLIWRGAAIHQIEAQLLAAQSNLELSTKSAPMYGLLALAQGKIAEAQAYARLALEQLPEQDRLLRGLAELIQISAVMLTGDMQRGIQEMERLLARSQSAENFLITNFLLCNLAENYHKLGEMGQAEKFYQQALDQAGRLGETLPVAVEAYAGLADILCEKNQLAQAEQHLNKAQDLAHRWGQANRISIFLNQARLYRALGDDEQVKTALIHARRIAQTTDMSFLDDYVVELHEMTRYLALGQLDALQDWLEKRGYHAPVDEIIHAQLADYGYSRLRKYEYPVLARYWLQQHRYDDVVVLMSHLNELAAQKKRLILRLEAQILLALAYQFRGESEQACAWMQSALAFAAPRGFCRTFVDEGEPARLLLQTLRAQVQDEPLLAYIDSLLAAFPGSEKAALPKKLVPAGLVEPLSERELEILPLLQTALSNPEIAAHLVISMNTLRTHLKSIYAKLDVHSRYQAVARAKELHLL